MLVCAGTAPEGWSPPSSSSVGRTWRRMVEKNEKDVLVVFHAPWCKHCQVLMPAVDKLAVTLRNEDVEIVSAMGAPSLHIRRARRDCKYNGRAEVVSATGAPRL